MTRLPFILGFLLIGVGTLLLLIWLIEPLRALWPHFLEHFLRFPLLIRIGLVTAAVGFILLLGTVIWERLQSRKTDKELQDEP